MSGYVHYSVLGDRLILAQLNDDHDALDMIGAEVGDSDQCWRSIAEQLAEVAAEQLTRELGHDVATAYTEAAIAYALDWLARWAEHDSGQT